MVEIFKKDMFRITGKMKKHYCYFRLNNNNKYLYWYRKMQASNKSFSKRFYHFFVIKYQNKTLIDISTKAKIGPGLMIVHRGWRIVGDACLGKNITLSPGTVIGAEWRGKRKGCPTIGNNVYIGANSTIVGNITIGDDVLIAPGSFINFDVPSHSVVFGNPGVIKQKDFATKDYQNFTI